MNYSKTNRIICCAGISCLFMTLSCMDRISRTIENFKNCTNDTLFIGLSINDNIDDIEYILYQSSARIPDSEADTTLIMYKDCLITDRYNFVIPDSLGSISINTHKLHNSDKFYFFLVKREDTKRYSWDEIRSKKLYRKCIITKDKNGNFDRNIRYQNQVED